MSGVYSVVRRHSRRHLPSEESAALQALPGRAIIVRGARRMRILGIDTGLAETGYGLIDADGRVYRAVDAGVIRTEAGVPLALRLRQIHGAIGEVVVEFSPERAVVEDLYAKFGHPRTAIMMGHARGVILLAAAERGLEVASYPASLVKRSLTGNGRASKQQVRRMVAQILRLEEAPSPDVGDLPRQSRAIRLGAAARYRTRDSRGRR